MNDRSIRQRGQFSPDLLISQDRLPAFDTPDDGPTSTVLNRVGPVVCFIIAVVLITAAIWMSMEAAQKGVDTGSWVNRLTGIAAVSAAHLLLAWGVTSRVFPISAVDKAVALTSIVVGLLTGVGAVALALAV